MDILAALRQEEAKLQKQVDIVRQQLDTASLVLCLGVPDAGRLSWRTDSI